MCRYGMDTKRGMLEEVWTEWLLSWAVLLEYGFCCCGNKRPEVAAVVAMSTSDGRGEPFMSASAAGGI